MLLYALWNKLMYDDKDLLHLLSFNDVMMPVLLWLQQEMGDSFIIVRHEDFLTEEGLNTFSTNAESLLGIERRKSRNLTKIARYMADKSSKCGEKSNIPAMMKKHVEYLMNAFNYTFE